MQTNTAMNTTANNALLNEAKYHLDRLAELAVAIHEAGQAGTAANALKAETPADYANGVALLGRMANDPINQTEYERLVNELGFTPTLDMAAFINLDLRESLANTLLALSL